MNARRKKKWKRQKMMEYGVLGLARKGRWKSKKGAQEKAGNIILRAWYRKLAYKRVKDLKSRRQNSCCCKSASAQARCCPGRGR